MAQNVDIIDLRRSYIPQDPNAFPVTMQTTQGEDNPEARIPMLPYDGYNFMPTPQGYASFFGVNSHIDIDSIYYIPAQEEIPAVAATVATYGPSPGWTYPEGVTIDELKAFTMTLWGYVDWTTLLQENYLVDTDEELLALGYDDMYDFFWTDVVPDVTVEFGPRVALQGPLLDPGNPEIPSIAEVEEQLGTVGVDDTFVIQTLEYQNIIVALCDDGIWIKYGGTSGAWTHTITLAPMEELHKEWSKCVIDNIIYVYRQGEAHVWIAGPDNDYVFTEATPTGINMAGQLGIFKAGGRLGFWDSENSTGWSSLTEPLEFGDAEKFSGFTIFQDIIGRIVIVLQHGDGFIIYCTKSIVLVRRTPTSQMLFSGSSIFNNAGISYRREACYANPDTSHFALTTQGFVEINGGQAQVSMPEITTYLKKSRQPVFLQVLNGRYLHFNVLDPYYLQSRSNFSTEIVDPTIYKFSSAAAIVDNENERTDYAVKSIKIGNSKHEQVYAFNNFGYTNYDSDQSGAYPVWKDKISSFVIVDNLKAWKDYEVGFFGSDKYWLDNIATAFEPTLLPITAASNVPTFPLLNSNSGPQWNPQKHVEANTRDFFFKQEFVWYLEQHYQDSWIRAFVKRIQMLQAGGGYSVNVISAISPSPTSFSVKHFSAWYPDLSFHAERNKYYGLTNKTAWLQRSLIRQIRLEYYMTFKWSNIVIGPTAQQWFITPDPGGIGSALGTNYITQVRAAVMVFINAKYGAGSWVAHNWKFDERLYPTVLVSSPTQGVLHTLSPNTFLSLPEWRRLGHVAALQYYTPGTAPVFYTITGDLQQTVSAPNVRYEYVDTCVIKELGYTFITGHGHYTDLGETFVEDDTTPETPDYVDICTTDPVQTNKASVNGVFIDNPFVNGSLAGEPFEEVHLDGDTFGFPESSSVAIPGSTIYLQDGSIEPIHPTFLGSFVFDIQYKKWGKSHQPFKHLLDLYPINNVSGNPIVYENFLPRSAALLPDGYIYPFDEYPAQSEIVFGKYGVYRKGFTDLHEIKIQHRSPMTGSIRVEGSLNGRDTESVVSKTESYENVRQHRFLASLSARWYNLIIEGHYDLTHMEVASTRSSRR